jgi:hypothetical protein
MSDERQFFTGPDTRPAAVILLGAAKRANITNKPNSVFNITYSTRDPSGDFTTMITANIHLGMVADVTMLWDTDGENATNGSIEVVFSGGGEPRTFHIENTDELKATYSALMTAWYSYLGQTRADGPKTLHRQPKRPYPPRSQEERQPSSNANRSPYESAPTKKQVPYGHPPEYNI